MAVGFRQRGLLSSFMPMDEEDTPLGGLLDAWGLKKKKEAVVPQASAPGQPATPGAEPTSFWQGGKNMTTRDALAAVLASASGAFSDVGAAAMGGRSRGNDGMGLSSLMAGRQARMEAAAAAQQAKQVQSDLLSQGYTAEEARLMALDPKAIGTNMAGRTGAYTLGKGDVRYNGNRQVAERPDTFETPMGDRYSVDSSGKTSQIYRENAPIYQSVDGVGVFGMDRHSPGVMGAGGGADRPVGKLTPAPAPTAIDNNPDAETMRRLYTQQFGAQQGQAMFQEWLRNSTKGGR